MRFGQTSEQSAFAAALDDLLSSSEVSAVSRDWARGETGPGLDLWRHLAELGVTALLVPDAYDGLGASPVDLTVAFNRLGYHGVPGPWVETVAVLPELLTQVDEGKALTAIASGEVLATLAAPPRVPRALDADVADHVFTLDADAMLQRGDPGSRRQSVDPTRRLFEVLPGDTAGIVDVGRALELGTLACSAQLLGAGGRLLADTVTYANQREQFGMPIGAQQAVKHLLADVRVALDFAAPLVHNAAVELDAEAPTAARSVSAAKVAAGDAAYLASRTALQVHGAIGYTREFDLSLWILKVRALVGAWGTPAEHRARILESLVEGR